MRSAIAPIAMLVAFSALSRHAEATPAGGASTEVMSAAAAAPGSCSYPTNCPNKVLPRADKQTWVMNKSTIIMPCNNTGFTDPNTTLGWGVVDFVRIGTTHTIHTPSCCPALFPDPSTSFPSLTQ